MVENFPATQGRMAESKPGKYFLALLGKKSCIKWMIQGDGVFDPTDPHRDTAHRRALFSSIHTSVRGELFTGLKAQFSSPPNTSSACCNCTGGTAVLPRVDGKFQWCWQHLPAQIGVCLNILSDLKWCVRVAHCFFLNGALIHESISRISDSSEDRGGDELWSTELL